MSDFQKAQSLNNRVKMLHIIYGPSQNYNKSPYEIMARLIEVYGLLSKYMLRKRDFRRSLEFLPKLFAWGIALLKAVNGTADDLERIILEKYPQCCAYCAAKPCRCWDKEKPSPDAATIKRMYYDRANSQKREVNDFALMFQQVYGETWLSEMEEREKDLSRIGFRMAEELAELAEAVRFHHLYPQNFENELADFFAWWFALFVSMRKVSGSEIQCDEMLWLEYPALCTYCQSLPCFCRAGPVRELMSKPAPWQTSEFDALTSLKNQSAYNADIVSIEEGKRQVVFPSACVRADVDKFKSVNDTYGHSAGDSALTHIATVLRRKARDRDILFRVSGDEFALLLPDSTEQEAVGLMTRVLADLKRSPVRWVGQDGITKEFLVSISVGVAECSDRNAIRMAFEAADAAAYTSKAEGRARVTAAGRQPQSSEH